MFLCTFAHSIALATYLAANEAPFQHPLALLPGHADRGELIPWEIPSKSTCLFYVFKLTRELTEKRYTT